jgi:hypothetical protein
VRRLILLMAAMGAAVLVVSGVAYAALVEVQREVELHKGEAV